MNDQRIYYVSPRLVGDVKSWTGSRDKPSWLLEHVADLGFNAVWFSPLQQTSDATKNFEGKVVDGSYYAIRDPFKLDQDISTGDHDQDRVLMHRFCREADRMGIKIYADLVFNHLALDHPLVLSEDKQIEEIRAKTGNRYELVRNPQTNAITGIDYESDGIKKQLQFYFRRDENLALTFGGSDHDLWTDVAQINYDSPRAMRYFVEGTKEAPGYLKQIIDWHLALGFKGFRCDAAYKIPAPAWQELIAHAHRQEPDVIFLAETLCLNSDKVAALGQAQIQGPDGPRPAFDFGMSSNHWWDYKADWIKGEETRLHAMSHLGGVGSPDNHDVQQTAPARHMEAFGADNKAKISDACARDYAISALAFTGVYMRMGYEYCWEKNQPVFRELVRPDMWRELQAARQGTELDITNQIRAINAYKAELGLSDCRVKLDVTPRREGVTLLECAYLEARSGHKAAQIALLVNRRMTQGPMTLPSEPLVKAGFMSAEKASDGPVQVRSFRVLSKGHKGREGHVTVLPRPRALLTCEHNGG